MTQNIYWCEKKGESFGLFVIAPARDYAKHIYSANIECRYADVRSRIIRRGVNELLPCVIDDEGSPLLKKYGLEYSEEEK